MPKISAVLLAGCMLLASAVTTAGTITAADVRAVIDATDAASVHQDTQGIGEFLSSEFSKYIDVPAGDIPATVKINREQYLDMIDRGWKSIESYSYDRRDTVINVARDGQSAESYSTIVETVVTSEGEEMTSKVREYATYVLEEGHPRIIRIESQTLVGDTTPDPF